MNAETPAMVLTRADLLAEGMRPRQITRAVQAGELVRIRRNHYLATPSVDTERAVRVGGRLACLSLLAAFGVFVLDAGLLHIHLPRTMSRLRNPDDACRTLDAPTRRGLVLHWWPLSRPREVLVGQVGLFDAVVQAVRCQTPRAAVATLDSVLHLGILTWVEVREVFAHLPSKYGPILRLVDGIAESGPETFVRLMLRQLGLRYEAQVEIDGVGRVDFVVEGWLIIECDSKAFHEGWAKQRRDRKRDLEAARQGFVTLRPLAEDVMYRPEDVLGALRGLTRRRRR